MINPDHHCLISHLEHEPSENLVRVQLVHLVGDNSVRPRSEFSNNLVRAACIDFIYAQRSGSSSDKIHSEMLTSHS